jgi:hypothetical protein
MLSESLKPATVADGATIAIAGATAALTIIAGIAIMIAIIGIVIAAIGIAVIGIMIVEIVTGMVITEKIRMVLNPAPAGFFFSNGLIICRCAPGEDSLSSWREGAAPGASVRLNSRP